MARDDTPKGPIRFHIHHRSTGRLLGTYMTSTQVREAKEALALRGDLLTAVTRCTQERRRTETNSPTRSSWRSGSEGDLSRLRVLTEHPVRHSAGPTSPGTTDR